MSNLRYKFIACSDIHSQMRSVNGQSVPPDPIKAYAEEIAKPGGPVAVMCCGDVMIGTNGVHGQSDGQRKLVNYVANITDDSLMCAGNHSSMFYYGTKSSEAEGLAAWSGLLGEKYAGATPTVVTREINGDLFIAVSDITNNGTRVTYSDDTIDELTDILEDAKTNHKRVFVLSHYPYPATYSGGTLTTGAVINENRFAPRISNGGGSVGSGAVVVNVQYPAYPSDLDALWNALKGNRVIWFTGHTHNYWEAGHTDGIVLYSGSSKSVSTSGSYATEAGYNYKVSLPYIKVADVTNGPYMVNLPSVRWNYQDALVEVYDDKVEIHERRYENESGIPYADTHIVGAMASGEGIGTGNIIPMSPVGDGNAQGTATLQGLDRDMPGKWGVLPDEIVHTVYITGAAVEPDEPEEPDEPDDPNPPEPPSGEGTTLWRYDPDTRRVFEVADVAAMYAQDGMIVTDVVYMMDGTEVPLRAGTPIGSEYEYAMAGGVLTIVRAPCSVSGGILYIE